MEGRPPLHLRLLAAAGLVVAFVFVTSLAEPDASSAAPATVHDEVVRTELGRIQGTEHTIRILTGRPEPRYEVLDASGRAISDALSYSELRERHPELANLIGTSADASAAAPLLDFDP